MPSARAPRPARFFRRNILVFSLECIGVGFARADPNGLQQVDHEDLAVTDLVGFRSDPDGLDDLIGKASAFFATAERDMVAEKAAAITEIKALMAEYGLTLDDLRDPVEDDSLRRDPSPH